MVLTQPEYFLPVILSVSVFRGPSKRELSEGMEPVQDVLRTWLNRSRIQFKRCAEAVFSTHVINEVVAHELSHSFPELPSEPVGSCLACRRKEASCKATTRCEGRDLSSCNIAICRCSGCSGMGVLSFCMALILNAEFDRAHWAGVMCSRNFCI